MTQKDKLLDEKEREPIAGFWYKVLANSPVGEVSTKEDLSIFKKLGSVIMDRKTEENEITYEIKFFFDANRYFTNDLLTVKIHEDAHGLFKTIKAT